MGNLERAYPAPCMNDVAITQVSGSICWPRIVASSAKAAGPPPSRRCEWISRDLRSRRKVERLRTRHWFIVGVIRAATIPATPAHGHQSYAQETQHGR